jgi:hypothetical protein
MQHVVFDLLDVSCTLNGAEFHQSAQVSIQLGLDVQGHLHVGDGQVSSACAATLLIATSTVCATASPLESLNVVLPTVPDLVTHWLHIHGRGRGCHQAVPSIDDTRLTRPEQQRALQFIEDAVDSVRAAVAPPADPQLQALGGLPSLRHR